MMHEPETSYSERARRKSREIALAIALTLAAALFVLTAWKNKSDETAAIMDRSSKPLHSTN